MKVYRDFRHGSRQSHFYTPVELLAIGAYTVCRQDFRPSQVEGLRQHSRRRLALCIGQFLKAPIDESPWPNMDYDGCQNKVNMLFQITSEPKLNSNAFGFFAIKKFKTFGSLNSIQIHVFILVTFDNLEPKLNFNAFGIWLFAIKKFK